MADTALPGPQSAGLAMRRFGLCGGPGDIARLGRDPLGALLAELDGVGGPPALPQPPELLTTETSIALLIAVREDTRQRHAEVAARNAAAGGMAEDVAPGPRPRDPSLPATGVIHRQELDRLLQLAIATPRPLEERLALFWTNHFTISSKRAQVAAMLGAFERSAIRPHMAGRFEDMLLAATLHPAMLRYLDNAFSIGPNAAVRGRRRPGPAANENLAREVLELHTLGVDGGYTQADVTEFAHALTGWTAGVWVPRSGPPDGTVFDPRRHEPGPRTILGRTYPANGAAQAPAVLRDLAAHPSTARHVTRRLVRHFLGDDAPPALAARLADVYRASGGHLGTVMAALLRAPEAWTPRMAKLRGPLEFVMATGRVMGAAQPAPAVLRDLRAMGQPVFRATSPRGWPEGDDAWATPDGIKTRLDWSINMAARTATEDPRILAVQAFGPDLTDETRTAIARAETPAQGIALLLMSPEMQRR